MATEPKTTGLTYRELLEMFPEVDNVRREIIDGELFVTAAPGGRHQDAVTQVLVALALHAREHGGKAQPAPRDVFFSEESVVEPDVLFITAEHRDRIEERFVRGAPDIVVEVSSPTTRRLELRRKLELYERNGVPEYWYVDLDAERIEVYRLEEARYGPPSILRRDEALTSPLLAGFSVPVDDVLGPPPD
jgi:Uma2 family endonuclease